MLDKEFAAILKRLSAAYQCPVLFDNGIVSSTQAIETGHIHKSTDYVNVAIQFSTLIQ